MKKLLLLIIISSLHSFLYSQTFDGNLGSKSLFWENEQKDFNSPPRANIFPMSLKLWDNYGGTNAPSTYGSLLELYGKYNHLVSQLYFKSNWEGGNIMYRSAFYGQDTWGEWRNLLDSKSDVESSGNLKINGTGNHYLLNGKVGIGTITPYSKLEIKGSSQVGYEVGSLKLSSSSVGQFMYFGYDDQYSAGYIQSVKPGTAQQNILLAPSGGNIGIGTTNPDEKLTVKGKIHAEEVRIDLNVPAPDYVFANDYKLKSLQEVEDYIKQNNHLPEIPSAKEIDKNGLMLAEMNMSLLKKMEEMTLYMIEMKKEIEILKNKK